MNKTILVTAAFLGVIGIITGAFAAHDLKELVSIEAQQSFETGVRYQMYHAILLLFVGGSSLIQEKTKSVIYYLIVIGLLFFSGSIYALATNVLTSFDFKSIAFITPIGGLLLILAWSFMAINFIKIK